MGVLLANTPVLETDRLILRAPAHGDFEVWDVFAQSDRAKYIGGPYSEKQSWRGFGHAIGHWIMHGWGSFVFTLKGDDKPLGMTGPWFPKGWPEKEIGWTIWHDDLEGTGLMFEAAACARDYAFEDLGWDTAVSYVDRPNVRSANLARRLGAVEDPNAEIMELDNDDVEVIVFRHPNPKVTL